MDWAKFARRRAAIVSLSWPTCTVRTLARFTAASRSLWSFSWAVRSVPMSAASVAPLSAGFGPSWSRRALAASSRGARSVTSACRSALTGSRSALNCCRLASEMSARPSAASMRSTVALSASRRAAGVWAACWVDAASCAKPGVAAVAKTSRAKLRTTIRARAMVDAGDRISGRDSRVADRSFASKRVFGAILRLCPAKLDEGEQWRVRDVMRSDLWSETGTWCGAAGRPPGPPRGFVDRPKGVELGADPYVAAMILP